MSTHDNGGPAFPIPAAHMPNGEWMWGDNGMTLRDYFAAKAMQGFCADPSNHDLFADYADVAKSAYQLADAMLEARK